MIWEIFKTLENDVLSINYLGEFKDSNTDFLINLSESNFENHIDLKKLKKKVSFLIAESFQNIVRHSDEILEQNKEEFNLSSFFSIRINEVVTITSANSIDNKHISNIEEMILQLNSLNEEQLKEMYLNVLSNTGHSEKGGAGLGLIEMARKSGQKLEHNFEKIDENNSMFFLRIKINPNEKESENIKKVVDFRKYYLNEKILFTYKGEFSKEIVFNLLSIIENNLAVLGTSSGQLKKAYIILVEMLQNISKHAYRQDDIIDGIFTLGIKDGKLNISTGNWITSEETTDLLAFIDFINAASPDEIKKLYQEKIKSETDSKHEGAGVGLINMIRFSKNTIHYDIHTKENSKLNFVTLTSII